jgi:indole-3-glycerol phosphate synthase
LIDQILKTKKEEVEGLRGYRPGQRTRPIVPLTFEGPINIIAELKKKSPSAGFIAPIGPERIGIYSKYAKAISVLTDRTYFGGSPEFLEEVAGQTPLPVLFKDFIIDPVQIDLAYGMGADIVLLIARILGEERLVALYSHARDLGLNCLVEVHEKTELELLTAIDARIIGVNARDLDTLQTNLQCAAAILRQVQAPVRIAESGIRARQDIEFMAASGATGFLIGETLMRAEDLDTTFQELLHG